MNYHWATFIFENGVCIVELTGEFGYMEWHEDDFWTIPVEQTPVYLQKFMEKTLLPVQMSVMLGKRTQTVITGTKPSPGVYLTQISGFFTE